MSTPLSFFYVKKKKQKKDTTRANLKIGSRTIPSAAKATDFEVGTPRG
jgi:hypothetical protein